MCLSTKKFSKRASKMLAPLSTGFAWIAGPNANITGPRCKPFFCKIRAHMRSPNAAFWSPFSECFSECQMYNFRVPYAECLDAG